MIAEALRAEVNFYIAAFAEEPAQAIVVRSTHSRDDDRVLRH
jgi:hypothetical protein